jgi:hypothetical protein
MRASREHGIPDRRLRERGESGLPSPLPVYRTDVSLTLPTTTSDHPVNNPNYKGCLDHKA